MWLVRVTQFARDSGLSDDKAQVRTVPHTGIRSSMYATCRPQGGAALRTVGPGGSGPQGVRGRQGREHRDPEPGPYPCPQGHRASLAAGDPAPLAESNDPPSQRTQRGAPDSSGSRLLAHRKPRHRSHSLLGFILMCFRQTASLETLLSDCIPIKLFPVPETEGNHVNNSSEGACVCVRVCVSGYLKTSLIFFIYRPLIPSDRNPFLSEVLIGLLCNL